MNQHRPASKVQTQLQKSYANFTTPDPEAIRPITLPFTERTTEAASFSRTINTIPIPMLNT
jgi:hypothetical protein